MDYARHNLKAALYEVYPTIKSASEDMSISISRLSCFLSGTLNPRKEEAESLMHHLKKDAKELGIEKIDPSLHKLKQAMFIKNGGLFKTAQLTSIYYKRLAAIANGKFIAREEEKLILQKVLKTPLKDLGL